MALYQNPYMYEYVSTYVPRPNQAYAKTIETLNDRFEAAVSQKSALDTIAGSIKAPTMESQEYLSSVFGGAKKAIDKYIDEGDFSNMDVAAKNVATEIANDERLKHIIAQSKIAAEIEQQQALLKSQGKSFVKNMKPVTKMVDGKEVTTWESPYEFGKQSLWNEQGPQQYQSEYVPRLDYNAALSKVIGNLTPEQMKQVVKKLDPSSIQGFSEADAESMKNQFIEMLKTTGVPPERLAAIAKEMAPYAMNDEALQQYLMVLNSGQEQEMINPEAMRYVGQGNSNTDIIARALYAANRDKLFKNRETSLMAMPTRTNEGGQFGEDYAGIGTVNFVSTAMRPFVDKLPQPGKGEQASDPGGLLSALWIGISNKVSGNSPLKPGPSAYENATPQGKEMFEAILAGAPNYLDPKSPEADEYVREAIKNGSATSATYMEYSPKRAAEVEKTLFKLEDGTAIYRGDGPLINFAGKGKDLLTREEVQQHLKNKTISAIGEVYPGSDFSFWGGKMIRTNEANEQYIVEPGYHERTPKLRTEAYQRMMASIGGKVATGAPAIMSHIVDGKTLTMRAHRDNVGALYISVKHGEDEEKWKLTINPEGRTVSQLLTPNKVSRNF